jgi:REP element-mobilizing transposase RayT
MIAGYHLIWTAYGFWLPNDPRGSSSHEIRVEKLRPLGDLHYGRRFIQPRAAELRSFYDEADDLLEHRRLTFTDDEILLIGATFGQTIQERGYTCYACAILPDHVHLLIRRHRDKAEEMIAWFQGDSNRALTEAGKRSVIHPVWGGPGWKVFLNTRHDMERSVTYVRENPRKAGRCEQLWDFVKEYDGWLPFRGRS